MMYVSGDCLVSVYPSGTGRRRRWSGGQDGFGDKVAPGLVSHGLAEPRKRQQNFWFHTRPYPSRGLSFTVRFQDPVKALLLLFRPPSALRALKPSGPSMAMVCQHEAIRSWSGGSRGNLGLAEVAIVPVTDHGIIRLEGPDEVRR
jgi:hypothetical protein